MKTRLTLLLGAALLGIVLAGGCGQGSDNGGGAGDGTAAAPQPSKQGGLEAQPGELQPPPNAPNPDNMMGSKAGGN